MGKFEFEGLLNFEEVTKILQEGTLDWDIVNESSPMLLVRKERPGKLTRRRKKSAIAMTVWQTGAFMISGARSVGESRAMRDEVLQEIKKIAPRVFVKN